MGTAPFYESVAPDARVGRGDIALVYLPQSRAMAEEAPPHAVPRRRINVPAYSGVLRVLDPVQMPAAELQVWPALAVVVMDSCELDRAHNQGRRREAWDSRVAVAPLIFDVHFPHAPWERMERGQVPLYGFFLEPLPAGVAGAATWPRAFVDLRGTALVSRRHVELNRRLRLSPLATDALALRVLEFWYLREVARDTDLVTRRGARLRDIVSVQLGSDYQEVRMIFEEAEPLTVICRTRAGE